MDIFISSKCDKVRWRQPRKTRREIRILGHTSFHNNISKHVKSFCWDIFQIYFTLMQKSNLSSKSTIFPLVIFGFQHWQQTRSGEFWDFFASLVWERKRSLLLRKYLLISMCELSERECVEEAIFAIPCFHIYLFRQTI